MPSAIHTCSSARSTLLLKRADSVSITRVRRMGCERAITRRTQTAPMATRTIKMPMIQCHLRDRLSDGIADKDSAAEPLAWRAACSHCLTDKASDYQNGIWFFLHATIF